MVRRRALVFTLLLLASVGCDHAAKQIAQSALSGIPGISLAADTVRFELTSNPGAFLSLGADLPSPLRELVFLGVIPLFLAGVCLLGLRAGFTSGWPLAGLALIAGGGLANWLDRLMNGGAVTDFVSLGVGPLRTGIFNLADVGISTGIALLLLARSRSGARP
jgi:signal peptidase II